MYIEMNIKKVRMQKNMTLRRLAQKTGISKTHICDIENNYKIPSLYISIILAKELGVNLNSIFTIKQ